MKILKLCKSGVLGLALFSVVSCGGAGTGSSSVTRTVTGSLSAAGAGLSRFAVSDSCQADTVIITDTLAQSESVTVGDDCSFSLGLETGKSYSISFLLNGEFIASLIFDSGSGLSTSAFNLGVDESALDLGIITINGNTATPTNNPLDQCDSDDDGVSDFDDDDDDNDGTSDDLEEDCDLDGYSDDLDDDDDSEYCGVDDGSPRVLEVKPRNDPQTGHGNDRVDLDKKVRARISCEIDTASVSSETFSVVSEDGLHAVACSYEFSDLTGRSHQVTCRHDDEDFLPDTVYTATLDGVLCVNGDAVQARSWSWLTEDEDDDDGDYEDEYEDSLDDDDSDDDSDDDDDDDSGDDDDSDDDSDDDDSNDD